MYILVKHGNGSFWIQPNEPNFANFIFWYHWTIRSPQLATKTPIFLRLAGVQWDSPQMHDAKGRIASALQLMDARLRQKPFLAGDKITAADIYAVGDVTILCLFVPFALTGYDGIT